MNMQNEHDLNTKSANAFGGTFAFFTNAQSQTKKCKRATNSTHNDTTNNGQKHNDRKKANL